MQVKAVAKFIHMSPKKVRLVADAVRGETVERSLATLRFMNKKATAPLAKIIESATANAVHNFELSRDNLFVKELRVDDAPTIKRWMPRAFGRATPIRKRMSHITVTVAEINDSGQKSGKQSEIAAPVKIGEMGPTASKTKKEGDAKQPAETKTPETQAANAPAKGAPAEGGNREKITKKMFRRKSG